MSSHAQQLIDRIEDRSAKVAVIGLGYVGLPLATALAEEGFCVTGIDVNAQKVAMIGQGKSYVSDIDADQIAPLVADGRLAATTDYAALEATDAIIICVPTPLSKTHDPDMSYIVSAADQIAQHHHAGQLVVLESTTYPGTTEEVVLPRLATPEHVVGKEFFLAFSPERIDPGRIDYTIRTTPKVLGGMTSRCLEVAQALYGTIIEQVVPVPDTRTAEMVKLLENTFRAVNIGLVNEFALMCDRLDISVWDVIAAASTKPYGFMPFYPGPGLGGHCIPLDPQYLAWKLRTLNYTSRFIEVATSVNTSMPHHVVGLVSDALNRRRKAINGSRILVLGAAYKPDVSDVRESPALDVLNQLVERQAQVYYNDPHVPTLRLDDCELASSEITDSLLTAMDAVVIITPHKAYDWARVVSLAPIVIDTRNATGSLGDQMNNVTKL